MRSSAIVLIGALFVAACGEREPYPYPESARARFEASCPSESAACRCTWDKLTRTMPYEEYEAALTRLHQTGNMDPRVTRARTQCLERHPS
jgi:hypothetical protein